MKTQTHKESYTNKPKTVSLSDLTSELLDELGECADYSITETDSETGDLRLTERYRKRLSRETGEYAIELTRLGLEQQAACVANCCAHGTVYKRCPKKHVAMAYHYQCHDPGCKSCGRGHNRVRTWLRSRDIDLIVSEPQSALELTLTRQGTVREDRDRMKSLSVKLLKRVGCDSVAHDVLDPNSKNVTLRIMLKGLAACWGHKRVKREWKTIAGPSASCSLWRVESGEPVKEALSKWLFAGIEPTLSLSGRIRAGIRLAFESCRFVRTTGDFYCPLSYEDLEARKKTRRARRDFEECPRCHDGKPLETIPVEQRVMVPAEEIEAGYELVIWRPEFPPVYEKLSRPILIAKGTKSLSDNSEAANDSDPLPSLYGPN